MLARPRVLRAVADVERGDRASGRPADGDAGRIDPIGRRALAQEPHCGLGVLACLDDRREAGGVDLRAADRVGAVVDRDRDVALAGEDGRLVDDLRRGLVEARPEAAAVDPHDRGPLRDRVARRPPHVEVEGDVGAQLIDGVAVDDVGRLGRAGEHQVAVAQRCVARRPQQRVAGGGDQQQRQDRTQQHSAHSTPPRSCPAARYTRAPATGHVRTARLPQRGRWLAQ